MKPQDKVEKVFTLSAYEGGAHRITGEVTKEKVKWDMLSIEESLSPLSSMINEFFQWPLGTQIKVTMEVEKQ